MKVETLKLPSVVDFAVGESVASAVCAYSLLSLYTESTRSHEWDSVVSCHAGHSSAQTWNLQKCVIGRHSLTSKHVDSGARPVVSNKKSEVHNKITAAL